MYDPQNMQTPYESSHILKPRFKRELNRNYLIIDNPAEANGSEYQEYQERIFLKSNIPGLLKCSIENIDGIKHYLYDITSKISLSTWCLTTPARAESIRQIFTGIINAASYFEDYLLDEEYLILDPEYVFVGRDTSEVLLCFCPAIKENITSGLQRLTGYFMNLVPADDKDAAVLMFDIYRSVSKEGCCIEDMRSCLGMGTFQDAFSITNFDKKPPETTSETDVDIALNNEAKDTDLERAILLDEFFSDDEFEEKNSSLFKDKKTNIKNMAKLSLIGAAIAIGIFFILHFLINVELDVYTVAGTVIAAFAVVFIALKIKGSFFHRNSHDTHDNFFDPNTKSQSGLQLESISGSRHGVQRKLLRNPYHEMSNKLQCEPHIRDQSLFFLGSSYDSQPEYHKIPESELDVDAYTTVLTEEKPSQGLLRALDEDMPDIKLGKDSTIIGKNKTMCDAVLSRPTISRMHARILVEDGTYILQDLGSKNGTSVNGRMLIGSETQSLTSGDTLRFADADFVFSKL